MTPDQVAALVAALKDCAQDLEYYVRAEYPPERRKYPSQEAKYQRDMEPVKNAKAALAAVGETLHDDAAAP